MLASDVILGNVIPMILAKSGDRVKFNYTVSKHTTAKYVRGIAITNAKAQITIITVFMLLVLLNVLDFSGKQITIYLWK